MWLFLTPAYRLSDTEHAQLLAGHSVASIAIDFTCEYCHGRVRW